MDQGVDFTIGKNDRLLLLSDMEAAMALGEIENRKVRATKEVLRKADDPEPQFDVLFVSIPLLRRGLMSKSGIMGPAQQDVAQGWGVTAKSLVTQSMYELWEGATKGSFRFVFSNTSQRLAR